MNSLQRDLLKFFISFISESSSDQETSNLLIRRMMKNKTVQQIIIDCLLQLEPILISELTKIKSKSATTLKSIQRASKLQILAKDIKILMTSFEQMKGSLESVTGIVENLETALIQRPQDLKPKFFEKETSLVEFLSNLAGKKNLTDSEIEGFSTEVWGKHMEVEKMLAAELVLYKVRWNSMQNTYFNRIFHIKLKTGEKIMRLEHELQEQKLHFINVIDQTAMRLEDRLSAEHRRYLFEIKLLQDEISEVYVPDLLSAVEKIKNLLMIRQVLEYNRAQDEKIIKMLNEKLQFMAEGYLESQQKLSQTVKTSAIITSCLVNIVKNSMLQEKPKQEILEYIQNGDWTEVEEAFNNPEFMEMIWNEKSIKEGNSGFIELSQKEEFRTRLARLLPNESPQKGSVKREGKPVGKSKSPRAKLVKINSPLSSPGHAPELHFFSVKKVILNFDNELKNKNKKIFESLSAISTLFTKQKQKFKEIQVKTRIAEPKHLPQKTFSEFSTQTEINFSKYILSESFSQTPTKSFDSSPSQTLLTSSNIAQMEKILNNRDIRKDYQKFMRDKLIHQETQTEKKIVFKEFEDSRMLARGMMRKFTAPSRNSNEPRTPNDFSSISSHLIKSVETGLLLSPIEDVHELDKAALEYSKEFGIYSQFLGYKKLDFSAIQTLWEEVINRRLAEEEKDQITRYLQGFAGTRNYEKEKFKIIQILMKIKQQSAEYEGYEQFILDFKKKLTVLNRWRKLLVGFFKRVSAEILEEFRKKKGLELIWVVGLLRIVRQDLRMMLEKRHIMKKSETSLVFKNEIWVNSSRSPVLAKKIAVKSRLFKTNHNNTYDKILRIKTPVRLRVRDNGKPQ